MEASIHLDTLIPESGLRGRALETVKNLGRQFSKSGPGAFGSLWGNFRGKLTGGPGPCHRAFRAKGQQGKKIAAPRGRRALGGLLFPPERM